MTDQNNAANPDGSQGTTKGNEDSQKSSQVDENHKPADKPTQPNPDVDGGNGPVST